MTQGQIWSLIKAERERQDMIHTGGDEFLHPLEWFRILGEEVGEVAKAMADADAKVLVDELVQVAAVAVVWLEQFDSEIG